MFQVFHLSSYVYCKCCISRCFKSRLGISPSSPSAASSRCLLLPVLDVHLNQRREQTLPPPPLLDVDDVRAARSSREACETECRHARMSKRSGTSPAVSVFYSCNSRRRHATCCVQLSSARILYEQWKQRTGTILGTTRRGLRMQHVSFPQMIPVTSANHAQEVYSDAGEVTCACTGARTRRRAEQP
jgi:hypothetical protein